MPVMSCSGFQPCNRLISVSAVPGGNPVAKSDPEGYASHWALCGNCGGYTCDRCLSRQQGRCRCGAPTRLLSEPEQIRIAQDIMQGRKPMGPTAIAAAQISSPAPAQAPARAAPAGMNAGGGVQASSLPAILFDLGRRVDGELAQNNRDRATATAALAAAMMGSLGAEVSADHVPWLMSFGESFYRWRCFPEGAEYWKGVFQHFHRHNTTGTDLGVRVVATVGCFQVLAGILRGDSQTAQQVMSLAQKVFGPDHVLVRDAMTRVNMAGASYGAMAPPPIDMRPSGPRASSATAGLDASTKLAIWVTLAFLDIAAADGKVGNDEYLVWKRTMANMELPDVWGRYGTQGLIDLLKRGVLQELSIEFASLGPDTKLHMVKILHSFVMADGRAEKHELETLQMIGSWLGLSIKFS